jgi:hypothetical protein
MIALRTCQQPGVTPHMVPRFIDVVVGSDPIAGAPALRACAAPRPSRIMTVFTHARRIEASCFDRHDQNTKRRRPRH